jgi:hypothetical protein
MAVDRLKKREKNSRVLAFGVVIEGIHFMGVGAYLKSRGETSAYATDRSKSGVG